MRRLLFTTLLGIAISASTAFAVDKVWSIPGVINSGGLATVFSCTNGNATPATVIVNLRDNSGTNAANVSSGLAANDAMIDFATQSVAMLSGETVIPGAPTLVSGSAAITATSGVYCTAYVVDSTNNPPSVAWPLTIVSKTKQKGD